MLQSARRSLLISPLLLALVAGQSNLTFSTVSAWSMKERFKISTPSEECFNCLIPKFKCGQFGECNQYDGQCECPEGWGGIDCLMPQCGSLADGPNRYPRGNAEHCECKEGWGGINCNVCQTDEACTNFPLRQLPESAFLQDAEEHNMTCYRNGPTIIENHQMCDVTNRQILYMLGDRTPQVTFSCNKNSSTCRFQFWVKEVESFYCALDTCEIGLKSEYNKNITEYTCQNMQCRCVPGRMLCGESGSIDISEFLEQDIRGPGKFSCTTGSGCKFEEDAMNELIASVFGDGYITLTCGGGECLHHSQTPGYQPPLQPNRTLWIVWSAAFAALIFVLASAGLWYLARAHSGSLGQIRLPENEAARFLNDHIPASLHFCDLSYSISSQPVLSGITGNVDSGEILAIMGASGSGKTTLLDILARKSKKGTVTGTKLVNGQFIKDEDFRDVVGFVDQEDTLMSTLTVYETVLYSALLRLPRDMSFEAKKYRTLETLNELGILNIKDSRIGDSGKRSISGGEKRRVSIACELVTSPSILFLDEPTSGLDSYNAFNVIESLVSLAKDFKRTVIFTIHQPRSNIVALFDKLILLARGRLIYSGPMSDVHSYFERIGHPCPPGFNIADYYVDLTMKTDEKRPYQSLANEVLSYEGTYPDEEREVGLQTASHGNGEDITMTAVESSPNVFTETASLSKRYLKHKTSQLLQAVSGPSKLDAPLSPELAALVEEYTKSDVAHTLRSQVGSLLANAANASPDGTSLVAAGHPLRSRQRATWITQFRILSGRAFKNLYRNPALLAAHYISSIAIAVLCSILFRDITNDIPGFQNRLGLFFFTLALFGLSCLSSLSLFSGERLLFIRERANGYYSSFTYFSSKIMFDIIPIRMIPPLVFGGIIYGPVGLVPSVSAFWKFLLILVLYNTTTASVVLLISIAVSSPSVASLVGTVVILYNLLFAGLLINRETLGDGLSWLLITSISHAAFEALAINELQYLQLKETKYGVEINVPAASILSSFGYRVQAFWWPDIALLCIMFGAFTVVSYIFLHYYVVEQR